MRVAGPLRVSANVSRSGSIVVTALDQEGNAIKHSKPITVDVSDRRVQWEKGGTLETLVGKDIRLRFVITSGRLYAFEL